MFYLHNQIVRWIFPLIAIFLPGCQFFALSGPNGSEPIGQWGTWTGIVTPIEVSNVHGEKFNVVTLSIDGGPQFTPRAYPVENTKPSERTEDMLRYAGKGKEPLLAQDTSQSHTILASELPVGKRITVQGWMEVTWANVPFNSNSQHGGNVARSDLGRRNDYMQGPEHVIVMRCYKIDGQGKWIDVPLDPLK